MEQIFELWDRRKNSRSISPWCGSPGGYQRRWLEWAGIPWSWGLFLSGVVRRRRTYRGNFSFRMYLYKPAAIVKICTAMIAAKFSRRQVLIPQLLSLRDMRNFCASTTLVVRKQYQSQINFLDFLQVIIVSSLLSIHVTTLSYAGIRHVQLLLLGQQKDILSPKRK